MDDKKFDELKNKLKQKSSKVVSQVSCSLPFAGYFCQEAEACQKCTLPASSLVVQHRQMMLSDAVGRHLSDAAAPSMARCRVLVAASGAGNCTQIARLTT
jgi:peroxiredoxin